MQKSVIIMIHLINIYNHVSKRNNMLHWYEVSSRVSVSDIEEL